MVNENIADNIVENINNTKHVSILTDLYIITEFQPETDHIFGSLPGSVIQQPET